MTWYEDEILCGDALEKLRQLPDATYHTCVTSPPYFGLRDYGVEGQIGKEASLDEYIEKLVQVFREVRRTLRDDGTLWLNLGDSYAGNTKPGGGDPTTGVRNLGGKDYSKKTVPRGLKSKDLIGVPWRVAFALQTDGWYLRSDIIWHKPNAMPESVTDRPTKAHEYIFLFAKSERYYYDHEAIKEPARNGDPMPPRGSKGVINNPLQSGYRKQDEVGKRQYTGFNARYQPLEKRNKRDVWTVSIKPFRGAHFATFPPDLIEPCILAGSPKGGYVLDPFFGSGTTGEVAMRNGRHFTGIELNPDFIEIAKKRLPKSVQLSLEA